MQAKVKIGYIGGPDLSLRLPIIKLLLSEGYKVHVLGSNKQEKVKFEKEGIPYWYYSLNRKFRILSDVRSFFQLRKILYQEKFCLVHTFDTKPTILGRIAARLSGVPIIIGTIPGLGSLFSEESLSNRILRKFYIFSQKVACKVSDMTILQNQDDRDFFVSRKITDSSKVKIVRGSGVDTKRFSPENVDLDAVKKIKKELCLNGGLVISMITRLVKYKGIEEYLEAASLLKVKYPNTDFLLVGPQDNTLAALSLEEISKYSNVVKYLGFRSDIPEILYLSDIVILPSYREGIPRALLEAGSMGKPIITTNVPGCKEVVEDGINGFLIPTKDVKALLEAIEKLVLNEDLRKKMGKLSRKKVVEEFDSNIVFKEMLNIYAIYLKNKFGYCFF